ncbi:MAG: aspartate carbamoyltransferase [Candidatus Woesearchaeota archaeon]
MESERMRDVITLRDFSRADIDTIVQEALTLMHQGSVRPMIRRKMASLFFEPSTRTRVSSETAGESENFYVNGFAGIEGTSVVKGEPLKDTIGMFEVYGNEIIVMRHFLQGAARYAADITPVPIINGGDGSNAHPTQGLLDLATIVEAHQKIDGQKIALVGDLRYSRVAPSNLLGLRHFDIELWLVSPPGLEMPEWRVKEYEQATGKKVITTPNLEEVMKIVDVLEVFRIQRERFPKGEEGEVQFRKAAGIYQITAEKLRNAHNPNLMVMHPLPRDKNVMEITMDVDDTPHAWFKRQAQIGMYVRQALYRKILEEGFEGIPQNHADPPTIYLPLGESRPKTKDTWILNNGTLIDHLEPGMGYKIAHLLGFDNSNQTAYPVPRLPSVRYGEKDVFVAKDIFLTPEQLNKIRLVSRTARVDIIRDSKIVQKFDPVLPYELTEVVECPNSRCISSPEHQEFAPSKFYVESQEPLHLRCHYCEQPIGRREVKLKY